MDVNTFSTFLSRHRIWNFVHEDFTAWVTAIQNATIKCLNSAAEWEENRSFIQVKRMTEYDLESETTDHLHFTEDDYEQTLDVVRLPIAIPQEIAQRAPEFLFIRPDDIALFRSISNNQWSILTGNPGISKSWFQWKFVLFCYRQDLFELLSRNKLRIDPEVSATNIEDIENVSDEDTNEKDIQRKRSKTSSFPLPDYIVRTVNGESSFWFALNRFEKVLEIRHRHVDLVSLTDANTTLLWEPGHGNLPIFSTGIVCKIIATVSPNPSIHHGIERDAQMFYMPCPSELQIRLMGQIYRKFAGVSTFPTDNVIRSRVKEYGPFIRIALSPYVSTVTKFAEKRDLEINLLFSQPRDLSKMLMSHHCLEQDLKNTGQVVNFSHRLARFVVEQDESDKFGGYTYRWYKFSCDYVLGYIKKEIANADIDFVIKHLVAVNMGMVKFKDVNPYFLERIFELHALTGIRWKYVQLKLGRSDGNVEWKDFHVKLEYVERKVTAFSNMKPGVLYYPSDRTFPLIDMYYKDLQNNLVCIQATMAKGHANALSTYKEFFETVGVPSGNIAIQLHYLTLPCWKDHYVSKTISNSKFYDEMKSINVAELNPNLSFYCLLPPDTFESEY
jgi:hypothetical protein